MAGIPHRDAYALRLDTQLLEKRQNVTPRHATAIVYGDGRDGFEFFAREIRAQLRAPSSLTLTRPSSSHSTKSATFANAIFAVAASTAPRKARKDLMPKGPTDFETKAAARE